MYHLIWGVIGDPGLSIENWMYYFDEDYHYYVEYWNRTPKDRWIYITHASDDLEPYDKSKFFLVYDSDTGEILAVMRGTASLPMEWVRVKSPDGSSLKVGYLSIEEHPEKEKIFERPENYRIELKQKKVKAK
jgi:hypothetical protein